jgi:hypothetical protein
VEERKPRTENIPEVVSVVNDIPEEIPRFSNIGSGNFWEERGERAPTLLHGACRLNLLNLMDYRQQAGIIEPGPVERASP